MKHRWVLALSLVGFTSCAGEASAIRPVAPAASVELVASPASSPISLEDAATFAALGDMLARWSIEGPMFCKAHLTRDDSATADGPRNCPGGMNVLLVAASGPGTGPATRSGPPAPAPPPQPSGGGRSPQRVNVPLSRYHEFNDDSQQTQIEVALKEDKLAITITSANAQGFAGVYVDLPTPIKPGSFSALEFVSPRVTSKLPLEVKLEGSDGHRQCFIHNRKPAQDLLRSPQDDRKVRLPLTKCNATQPLDRLTFSATPSARGKEAWPPTPQRLQFTVSDVTFVP
jgi:hypothetical protein